MKMYAIENASLEIDATSVRFSKQDVIDLIESRFGKGEGRHLSVIEVDDGDDILMDILDTITGDYGPLSVVVAERATKKVVWPEK